MHDIFISYSSKNDGEAEAIREALERAGFSCWYAPSRLRGSQDFTKEIPAAMRDCRTYLLLVSQAAQESPWVQRELGWANKLQMPVYVLFLEDCPLVDSFGFVLQFNQYYEAKLGRQAQIDRLVRELGEDLQRPVPDTVPVTCPLMSPDQTPKPRKKRWPLVVAAVAAVVIAAAVAAVLLLGGDSRDGKYVVWNPAFAVALTGEEVHNYYLTGEKVTAGTGSPTGYTPRSVWELEFAGDGSFTLTQNGEKLGVRPGYNGIGLGGDYTATVWTLSEAGDGLYYVTNKETGYHLEWYAQKINWNVHNQITEDNRDQFLVRLDKID